MNMWRNRRILVMLVVALVLPTLATAAPVAQYRSGWPTAPSITAQATTVNVSGEYFGQVKLQGVYSGTLTDTTTPAARDLGQIELGLKLTQTGTSVTGYVTLDRTLVFAQRSTVAGKPVGPSVSGTFDGTTLRLTSEVFPQKLFSGTDSAHEVKREVKRQFSLATSQVQAGGNVLVGTYRETLWGYAPQPTTVVGSFTISRPSYPRTPNIPTPNVNLLSNPGFEADGNADGKPDGWTPDSRVSRSGVAKLGGRYSMRHTASNNSNYVVEQVVPGMIPGKAYLAGAWVNIPATSDAFSLTLQVQWRTGTDAVIATVPIGVFRAATRGWTDATARLVAPADAKKAVVRMAVQSLNATFYVDDVVLQGGTLLANSGFELDANNDGKADNWTAASAVSRSATLRLSGRYAMRHAATTNATYTVDQAAPNLVAGATYRVDGVVNIPSTTDAFSFRLQVVWRNASNGVIRTDTVGTLSAATGRWRPLGSTLVAPLGTSNAVVRMAVSSLNATLYVDDVTLRVANHAINSGFELDANRDGRPDSWTSDSRATRSSLAKHSGTYALRLSAANNSSFAIQQVATKLQEGSTYTVDGWVNIPATADAFTVTMEVQWRNAAGVNLGPALPVRVWNKATGGWQRASASLAGPPAATQAIVRLRVQSLNATIYVDDITFRP